jgi:mono/diheme cytochrome c family protein
MTREAADPAPHAAIPLTVTFNNIELIRSASKGIGGVIAFVGVLASLPTALTQNAGLEQDKAKIAAGEIVYNAHCSTCHGDQLVNTGQTFDLRRLSANDRARFDNSVRNGKNQMPPWRGVLSEEEIDQVWSYIRANAYRK